jgi:hypothetical protein
MLSDITAPPITSSAVASPVPSTTAAAGMVDLGRLAAIMKGGRADVPAHLEDGRHRDRLANECRVAVD